ncbi:extracellular solute-binding protein [Tistrella mobilis]|uniref:ABC superfamily ATP binding cassette transporter, binding protein n=1 Tax=Tistrella mobilis (strain KA081020-065) TaxID=1110502 RepID=I3TUC0_TISMK|nr:extracellular solute-binding protein [Tistrella mobilis]AFK56358.1 ABC superfamily ATP binding cassette transporter, binding protein [Tistrella mobilis KA081020-065]
MSRPTLLKTLILAGTALIGSLAVTSLPAAAETAVLYASNNSAAVDALLKVVGDAAPDLEVEVVRGATGALLKRIEAEAAAPEADLFWSAGFPTLAAYGAVLAPYHTRVELPADMVGPDGLWTGANVHVMVLMVNDRRLDGRSMPAGWADLFDPAWKGQVVIGDPANSSSAYAQIYGLYQLFGREGLEKLARNVVVTGSSSNVYKSVAAGEFAAGITMEYSAEAYVAGGQSEIRLVYPAEGTFLSPEGMAVVKGAPHPQAAQRLLDIMASDAAQAAIFAATWRRPANDRVDVTAIAGLPRLADLTVIAVDQDAAARDRDQVLAIWQEVTAAAR